MDFLQPNQCTEFYTFSAYSLIIYHSLICLPISTHWSKSTIFLTLPLTAHQELNISLRLRHDTSIAKAIKYLLVLSGSAFGLNQNHKNRLEWNKIETWRRGLVWSKTQFKPNKIYTLCPSDTWKNLYASSV